MAKSMNTVDVLMRPTLRFAGVSHVKASSKDTAEQHIYMLTDQARSAQTGQPVPQLQAVAKDSTLVREILLGFFGAVRKGILYNPSAEAKAAAEHFSSLVNDKSSYTTVGYYQAMYNIMSTKDSAGFAIIDPLLTIHNGYCYFEVFDKKARRSLTLTLEPSLWKDGFTSQDGTARVSLTPEFINGLLGLSSRFDINFSIGPNVGDPATEKTWKGEVSKTFSVDLLWLRNALMLQGVPALSTHSVDLVRINLFNTLRTLRMRKPRTHKSFDDREPASIRFLLKPGKPPIMVLDPWKLHIPCTGDNYQGPKEREVLMFGKRRDMLLFDRFLPYVKEANFTLLDSALHVCLDIAGEGFQCSIVLRGFSKFNWPRRLQMETMLPPFVARQDDTFLQALTKQGAHVFTGDESLAEKKKCISEVILGEAMFFPSKKTFIRRSLFADPINVEELQVVGRADTVAREHLAAGRVNMKVQFHTNGNLVFTGSTVTEALREGETEAFVAEPKFELEPDGTLAKVGCSCVVWDNEKERGYGGPCSHVRALWLNYCQEIESLREAKDAGQDTGPVLQETKTFMRKTEERIVEFDLRTKFKFIERWRTNEQSSFRQTVQVYSSEEAARKTFQKRCSALTRRGFEAS